MAEMFVEKVARYELEKMLGETVIEIFVMGEDTFQVCAYKCYWFDIQILL